jgi:hypothetical protein
MGNSGTDVAALNLASGAVSYAPFGTPVPTTASASLDADFVTLGLIDENDLQDTGDAASVTEIRDSTGSVVISVTDTPATKRYTVGLMSVFDEDVQNFIHGDANVSSTAATTLAGKKMTVLDKGYEPANCIFVIDQVYSGKKVRRVLENGKPTITAVRPGTRTTAAGYDLQITALKDDAGVKETTYYQNDDLAEA